MKALSACCERGVGVGARVHQEIVGPLGAHDESLLAVEHIAHRPRARGGRRPEEVGAAPRLGQSLGHRQLALEGWA